MLRLPFTPTKVQKNPHVNNPHTQIFLFLIKIFPNY